MQMLRHASRPTVVWSYRLLTETLLREIVGKKIKPGLYRSRSGGPSQHRRLMERKKEGFHVIPTSPLATG